MREDAAPGAVRLHYVTSPDRAGLALAAGGALAGLVVVALIVAGGQRAPWAIVGGWLLGSLFATFAIVAVAGPVWLALHALQRRDPKTAALTGAAIALLLFVAAQTWSAGEASLGGLASTFATSTLVAAAAAVIGWVMQRIAYRRAM